MDRCEALVSFVPPASPAAALTLRSPCPRQAAIPLLSGHKRANEAGRAAGAVVWRSALASDLADAEG